ncbi:hypothetical protein LBMAG42_54050 [Deltaproteobacteria bacterium]|nr:hypothetical protein LBMAG42_54050 [Deltaproteobacteria bacterium]
MPETKDPLAALDAKDIPTRAAGARDLALTGGPEVIDRLLSVATRDNSPGVRLAAAGAAADILSRHRLPPREALIPGDDRARWLATVIAVDPGLNTGLFAVCGTLGTAAAFNRVLIGLRDPRQDVRAGACVGLWRAVASSAYNGDAEAEGRVVATLSDARIRVETRVEIARICADAGYRSALEPARALPEQATRQTRTAAEELVVRLEAAPVLTGVWVDEGLDVMAVGLKARAGAIAAILGEGDAVFTEENGEVSRSTLPSPLRVLRAKAGDKESPGPVLQIGSRTWWPAGGEEFCVFGDRLIAAGRFDWLTACDELLGTHSAGLRVRGSALLQQGRLAEALLVLEACVAGKKVPADAWWFLAEALHRLERGGEAAPHLERYLAKAGKRAPFLDEARRRLSLFAVEGPPEDLPTE